MPAETLTLEMRARDRASKEIGKVGRSLGGLRKGIAGIGKAAGVLSAVGGAALTAFAAKAIKASAAQERTHAQLGGALGRVGVAYGDVRARIDEFAAAQQKATRFGDDETQAVLTRLVNLTGTYSEATLDAARAVQDFATAQGVDAANAALLVGKAASGSASLLTRYGITLTEAQAEAIKSADAGERLAAVTEALTGKFGGASTQLDSTTLGLARIRNGLGDVVEAVGLAVTGGGSLGIALGGIADGLIEAEMWVGRNADAVRDVLVGAFAAGAGAARLLAFAVKGLVQAYAAVVDVGGPMLRMVAEVAKAFAAGPRGIALMAKDLTSGGAFVQATEDARDGLARLEGSVLGQEAVFDALSGALDTAIARMREFKGASGTQAVGGTRVGPVAAPRAPAAGGGGGAIDEGLDFTEAVEAEEALAALRAAIRATALEFSANALPSSDLFTESLAALSAQTGELQAALDEGLLAPEDIEPAREALAGLIEDQAAYVDAVRQAEAANAAFGDSAVSMASVFRDQVAPLATAALDAMAGGLSDLVAGSDKAGEDMIANFLRAIGSIAVNLGSMLILAGAGLSVIPGFQASAAAVGAGIALLALGATMGGIGTRMTAKAPRRERGAEDTDTFRSAGFRSDEDLRRDRQPSVTVNFGGRAFVTEEEVARALSMALGRGARAGVLAPSGGGFRR